MRCEIKELNFECIQIGRTYLIPHIPNKDLSEVSLIPVKINYLEKDCFGYEIDGVCLYESFENPSGAVIKKSEDGLEIYIGKQILEQLSKNF